MEPEGANILFLFFLIWREKVQNFKQASIKDQKVQNTPAASTHSSICDSCNKLLTVTILNTIVTLCHLH